MSGIPLPSQALEYRGHHDACQSVMPVPLHTGSTSYGTAHRQYTRVSWVQKSRSRNIPIANNTVVPVTSHNSHRLRCSVLCTGSVYSFYRERQVSKVRHMAAGGSCASGRSCICLIMTKAIRAQLWPYRGSLRPLDSLLLVSRCQTGSSHETSMSVGSWPLRPAF